jgi:hypothetical protein
MPASIIQAPSDIARLKSLGQGKNAGDTKEALDIFLRTTDPLVEREAAKTIRNIGSRVRSNMTERIEFADLLSSAVDEKKRAERRENGVCEDKMIKIVDIVGKLGVYEFESLLLTIATNFGEAGARPYAAYAKLRVAALRVLGDWDCSYVFNENLLADKEPTVAQYALEYMALTDTEWRKLAEISQGNRELRQKVADLDWQIIGRFVFGMENANETLIRLAMRDIRLYSERMMEHYADAFWLNENAGRETRYDARRYFALDTEDSALVARKVNREIFRASLTFQEPSSILGRLMALELIMDFAASGISFARTKLVEVVDGLRDRAEEQHDELLGKILTITLSRLNLHEDGNGRILSISIKVVPYSVEDDVGALGL